MKIIELPNRNEYQGLGDLAMYRSVQQNGVLADSEQELFDAFDFTKTFEGFEFWDKINDCEFDAYVMHYPTGFKMLPVLKLGPTLTQYYLGHGGC